MAVVAEQIIEKAKVGQWMPPSPVAMLKLSQVLDNPNVQIKEIAAVIGQDPSLSMSLVRVANSAKFAGLSQITSLNKVVERLGANNIQTIAHAVYLSQVIKGDTQLDSKHFLRHSIVSGVVAKTIAAHHGCMKTDDAFLAGLMHEMGIYLLDLVIGTPYTHVREKSKGNMNRLVVHEKQDLNLTHAQVAAVLLREWHFSTQLIQAVQFHHDPLHAVEPHRNAALVTALAEAGTVFLGYDNGVGHAEAKTLPQEADTWLAQLKLDKTVYLRYLSEAEQTYKHSVLADIQ